MEAKNCVCGQTDFLASKEFPRVSLLSLASPLGVTIHALLTRSLVLLDLFLYTYHFFRGFSFFQSRHFLPELFFSFLYSLSSDFIVTTLTQELHTGELRDSQCCDSPTSSSLLQVLGPFRSHYHTPRKTCAFFRHARATELRLPSNKDLFHPQRLQQRCCCSSARAPTATVLLQQRLQQRLEAGTQAAGGSGNLYVAVTSSSLQSGRRPPEEPLHTSAFCF